MGIKLRRHPIDRGRRDHQHAPPWTEHLHAKNAPGPPSLDRRMEASNSMRLSISPPLRLLYAPPAREMTPLVLPTNEHVLRPHPLGTAY
jgi:hypothetical protein